jgi:hypothetical protein
MLTNEQLVFCRDLAGDVIGRMHASARADLTPLQRGLRNASLIKGISSSLPVSVLPPAGNASCCS